MNWGVVENCIAMVTIALIAVLASKFGVDSTLSGAAIAAIAGITGHGASEFVKRSISKPAEPAGKDGQA